MCENLGKVKLTLTVERQVIEKARKLGLNLSQVAENAFVDMINRLEGSNSQNSNVSSVNASSKEGLRRARRDLDPRPSG